MRLARDGRDAGPLYVSAFVSSLVSRGRASTGLVLDARRS